MFGAWQNVGAKDFDSVSQLYWHMGNTLDACVTYLVQAKRKDDDGIVSKSYPLFMTKVGTPEKPGWWRDDYGWWGIAFLNAVQPDHAAVLGLDAATKQQCLDAADLGWRIMNYDWIANKHQGVRNDPSGKLTETNTITNVLFLMLSLRRYELISDLTKKEEALRTAGDVFDWFYNAKPPGPNANGLFNSTNLIRYLPSSSDERAWCADQGWFWRACADLFKFDTSVDRRQRIDQVIGQLQPAIPKNVFVNGVAKELPYYQNYDADFATGPGVFMRQFAFMNAARTKDRWDDLIRRSAQAAWNYSKFDNPPPTGAWGCWYPNDCVYTQADNSKLWMLTLKTSAQDAFNAYMTVPP
jgi:hypothetical protein